MPQGSSAVRLTNGLYLLPFCCHYRKERWGLDFHLRDALHFTVRVDAGGPVSNTAAVPPLQDVHCGYSKMLTPTSHTSSEVMLQTVISRPVLSGGKSKLTAVPFVSISSTSGHAARMPLRNAIAVLVGTRR